ncbi:pseudouridine synthase [Methylobacterium oryzae CBMB20]
MFDVLPEDLPRVVAVGRLDINTEGLLLLTNDGGLAKVIAHPDTGWLRRYRVRAHGDTDQAQLDRLAKGVTIDGMEYGPVERRPSTACRATTSGLTLGLREGKNREVKRILEHLGLSVNRLIRLSFRAVPARRPGGRSGRGGADPRPQGSARQEPCRAGQRGFRQPGAGPDRAVRRLPRGGPGIPIRRAGTGPARCRASRTGAARLDRRHRSRTAERHVA